MANEPRPIPPIRLQPPSVDFIDNRLPSYHDAFQHPNARFDSALQQFVSNVTNTTASNDAGSGAASAQAPTFPSRGALESGSNRDPTAFWTAIFSEAMVEFVAKYPEPKDRAKSGYSVRTQTTWDGINAQLQKAREVYDGTKQGFSGRCKRAFRKIGDKAVDPAKQFAKALPEFDYTSPVLAAVQLLADTFQTASEVRERVTSSFEEKDLEELFGDIEVFLATFPDKDKLREASITLVVSVMKAVEDAIGFFLSNQRSRAMSALGRGKAYQKPLLTSLDDIQTNSEKLIHQAQNAHIAETQEGLKAIWDQTGRLIFIQQQAGLAVVYMMDKVDSIERAGLRILNVVNNLLNDAADNKKDLAQLTSAVAHLTEKVVDLASRGSTPQPERQQLAWPSPGLPALSSPSPYHTLMWVPHQQQQPPALPQQHHQYPPQFPHMPGPYTFPPGAFPGFPPPITAPTPAQPQPTLSETLTPHLGPPNLDLADISAISTSTSQIPLPDRARAERVAQTPQFRSWLVTPSSRELLIHGDFPRPGGTSLRVSGLSLLCAMVLQAVRAREGYIGLGFFCGRHVEEDDAALGGRGMVRSLVGQLVRDLGEVRGWEGDVEGVRRGDVGALCALFVWLVVNRVEEGRTVVVLVDGVSHYETDEWEGDMLKVLKMLLALVRDGVGGAVVKVLVTSPWSTDEVQELFGEDDEKGFISMAELPRAGNSFSTMRLESSLNRRVSGGDDSNGEDDEDDDDDDDDEDDDDEDEDDD
ncbi:hypothetical protein B0T25DRAFT_567070 [Lasiosphaeria hispida]|uniref:Fungal STAND N-terminal Goodbye domain-containing protein n=1 Tax=Lasiosphaeria hispida TaxID=260671 RepID=A0AAJ0MGH8_9PEZI|nr:hypothetical protein B0T25DRAFT_567070 [Lasiosphaeria hispida]